VLSGEEVGVELLFVLVELADAAVELRFGLVELVEGALPRVVERRRFEITGFLPALVVIFPARTRLRVSCNSRSARRFSFSKWETFFCSSSMRLRQPALSLVPSDGDPGVSARSMALSARVSSW